MKKTLVACPYLCPPGGGAGVGAFTLQALRNDYELSVACMQRPDYDGLNRFFGTDLADSDVTHYVVPAWLESAVRLLPGTQGSLHYALVERLVDRLSRRERFDVFVSVSNELSFPRRGIQYVYYPRTDPVRPEVDYRWYHRRAPVLMKLYRRFCEWVGGGSPDAIRRNLTLMTSHYTAGIFKRIHGVDPRVVYPPVPGTWPRAHPWEERAERFVCVGRLSPEKELPKIFDILRQVRERGHDISLTVVGAWDCSGAYSERLRRLFEAHAGWITLREGLRREDVTRLLETSRYGIHGMVGEHFGIAVAEMQQAGAVAFVPDTGGPVEIVGNRREQVYISVDDAVEKIHAVLADRKLQEELHRHACSRRDLFSAERFMREIRDAVDGMGA